MKVLKLFTDKNYRFQVLKKYGLDFIFSEKEWIKRNWESVEGTKIDLDNPSTFNEKIQYIMLNDHNPLYTKLQDKYQVREYIKNKIGEEYLVPLVGGPWSKYDDINFNELPMEFCLKTNHDSGGVVLCLNKEKLDYNKTKKIINKSLARNYYKFSHEWAYKNITPCIIAEKLVSHSPRDYKIFCFGGKAYYVYVSDKSHTEDQCIQFYDRDFNPVDIKRKDYKDYEQIPARPENYQKMIEIAEKLAEGLPQVRVDLYNENGQILFGEFTFYTSAGHIPFVDEKWNRHLGSLIDLKEIKPFS